MALEKLTKGGFDTTPFKFTQAGDELKGYYQGQSNKTINGKPVIEHVYKNEAGKHSVLGQSDILRQLEANGVEPGMWVEIVFSGKMAKTRSGNTVKLYDIGVDRADTQAVEDAGDGIVDEEDIQKAPPPKASVQSRVQAALAGGRSHTFKP